MKRPKAQRFPDPYLFVFIFYILLFTLDASKSPRNGGNGSGPTSWTGNSSSATSSQATKNHFNSTGPRSANFGSGNLQNSTSNSSLTNSYSSSSLVSPFKKRYYYFHTFLIKLFSG